MQIHMRMEQNIASVAVRAYIEHELLNSLRRFSPRIRRTTLQIVDNNGPRGGMDKTCRINIRLVPTGSVRIEDTDVDMFAAVDRAIERATRSVSRAIERVRDSERDVSRQTSARRSSTRLDTDE
jgi:putative sigma-54 modulation protein